MSVPDHPNARPPTDNAGLFAAATRLDALEAAWVKVRANAGAAGGDGVSVEHFDELAATHLLRLHRALRDGAYRPGPLRRFSIPKSSGGQRPLDIPCVVDRVAQTAVAQTLTPVLEPEMEPESYGYRPGRSVQQAVRRIDRLRQDGFTWVVDGDIERYFETVPHDPLLARLARTIGEGPLSELIALWLETAMPEGRGLPQGSPLSPLLANLYLDDVDEALAGRGVRLVRFADDFVVLCKSRASAERALDRAAALLAERGLELHREKSRIVSFQQGFRFLGHLFVRSLVMPSKAETTETDAADPAAELLRQVARADAETAAQKADAQARATREERAGLDRVVRVLYVMEPHRRLALRNTAFSVEEAAGIHGRDGAGDWRELLAVAHQEIDRIEIGPRGGATTEVLRHAAANDTEVAFVNGRGESWGVLRAPRTARAGRQLAQARAALDDELRLDLARRIVDGRLRNQRALLRRLNRRRKAQLALDAALTLNRAIRGLASAADVPDLLGREGAATAAYWRGLAALFEPPWRFSERKRRPPPDPVNAVFSYLAAMLARDVSTLVNRHGLHPGFGALHGARDGGEACVYDLMEEFRAPLAEGLAVYLCNNGILRAEMFGEAPDGGCRLGAEAVRAIIRGYEHWLARPVRSPRRGVRVAWRRLIEEQVVAYANHVEAQGTYAPYVMDY